MNRGKITKSDFSKKSELKLNLNPSVACLYVEQGTEIWSLSSKAFLIQVVQNKR